MYMLRQINIIVMEHFIVFALFFLGIYYDKLTVLMLASASYIMIYVAESFMLYSEKYATAHFVLTLWATTLIAAGYGLLFYMGYANVFH